jgi:hypothetical protein
MMNLISPSLKIGLEYDEDDEFKVYTFNDPIETRNIVKFKTGHYNFYFLMLKCQISIALNYIEK